MNRGGIPMEYLFVGNGIFVGATSSFLSYSLVCPVFWGRHVPSVGGRTTGRPVLPFEETVPFPVDTDGL